MHHHQHHQGRAIVTAAPRPYAATAYASQTGEARLNCSNFPDNEDIKLRLTFANRDKLEPRKLYEEVFGIGIWEYAVCKPEFANVEERVLIFANSDAFNIPFTSELPDPLLKPIYFTPEKLILEGLIPVEALGQIPEPEDYRWYEFEIWSERASQVLDSGAFTRTPRDRGKTRQIHFHRTPSWIP